MSSDFIDKTRNNGVIQYKDVILPADEGIVTTMYTFMDYARALYDMLRYSDHLAPFGRGMTGVHWLPPHLAATDLASRDAALTTLYSEMQSVCKIIAFSHEYPDPCAVTGVADCIPSSTAFNIWLSAPHFVIEQLHADDVAPLQLGSSSTTVIEPILNRSVP